MGDREPRAIDLLTRAQPTYEHLLGRAIDGGNPLHMDDIVATVGRGVPDGFFAPTRAGRSRDESIRTMIRGTIAGASNVNQTAGAPATSCSRK